MPIDFFKASCISSTTEAIFGIIDTPPVAFSFNDEENWIVWVENDNEKNVTLTAIDKCIDIPSIEGERCEGMLTYDTTIAFIELKDRNSGRWLGKSIDQLKNTIRLFKRDAKSARYDLQLAYISNKQRPHFKASSPVLTEKFKDETGFILRITEVIEIK